MVAKSITDLIALHVCWISSSVKVGCTKNIKDVSPNWSQGFNGMSDVRVTDMDMRDDYAVFASTYGRGVYSSYFDSDVPMLRLTSKENKWSIIVCSKNSYWNTKCDRKITMQKGSIQLDLNS